MRVSSLALVTLLSLAACDEKATLPVEAGVGPNPTLPAPKKALFPTVNIAEVKPWPAGAAPAPASGLAVNLFAQNLQHPRWLLTLPDGGILVAEGRFHVPKIEICRRTLPQCQGMTDQTSCFRKVALLPLHHTQEMGCIKVAWELG